MAIVAEAGIEVLGLDQARGNFLAELHVNPPAEEGVFESDNSGQTWKAAQLPAINGGISARILFSSSAGVASQTSKHSADGHEIYGVVATDHNGFLAATSRGLMRSDEVEMAWKAVPGLLEGSTVTAICNTRRIRMLCSRPSSG